MSDPPAPPTQSVPPPPVQRIDWLALAPWLILLRVPGVTLGWPLVFGALASSCLDRPSGKPAAEIGDLSGHVASALEAFARLPGSLVSGEAVELGGSSGWPGLFGAVGGWLAWSFVGLVITNASVGSLTNTEGAAGGPRRVVFSRRWPLSLLGAACLIGSAVGLLAALLWLVGRIASLDGSGMLASLLVPLGALLLGLPLAICLIGAVLGFPLLIASVVVDDADAFDGCSRVYGYIFQRLGRFVFYLSVAALMGVFAGVFLEVLIATVVACTAFCVGTPDNGWPLIGAAGVCLQAARGFYPAYFFTASTAIYLLLRRDVDGQPINEMAVPTDQTSADA